MTGTDVVAVTLRPATSEDREFLLAVYASSRASELDQVEWGPGQREAFVEMQFAAQDQDYRRRNPHGFFGVIHVEGQAAGRLYLDRRPGDLRIVDIALLPAYRNRGIGASLIRGLQGLAAEEGRGVSVHVEVNNRAARLYERLGFVRAEDLGVYRRMEWTP